MKIGVNKVVIAGGGTAGWMAAAALTKLLGRQLQVTLIESDDIATIGVGEASIPPLQDFHKFLQIDEASFLKATQGTFKLGIQFENWRDVGDDYIHAFGSTGQQSWAAGFQHFWLKARRQGIAGNYGDYCVEQVAAKQQKFAHVKNSGLNYAYHFDASLYAKFLRRIAEQQGITRVEGKIEQVNVEHDSGSIKSIVLQSGQIIEGDLFLDCTGQRALLIEKALHTGFEDWSHWLPCDSAIAVQTKAVNKPLPYTRSIAQQFGWQWQIPLQNRVGNGIVYSSNYVSDDIALSTLTSNLVGDTITNPLHIKFRTGTRHKHWNKNCVAVGLSSGFLEPLESTSIHLIQQAIIRLIRLFPYHGIKESDINEFNKQTKFDVERIRDFIVLHYKVTNRNDVNFWSHCRNMDIPQTLTHKIQLFKETGRMFRENNELFNDSWMQVMIGQGLLPESYHPMVDNLSDQELRDFFIHLENKVAKIVHHLPMHSDYVKQYCEANLN